MLPSRNLYAFAAKGQDCSKCHTIKKEEAASILKNFDQNIKVLAVNKSQVKYLWEVSFESNGKKGILYIDMPKKHIFSGALISVQGKENLTEDSLSMLKKVNVSQIPLKDALILGSKSAKRKIIVFDDPEWPFCARLHQEMKKVVKERTDIAFYIKMFPLKIHPGAVDKARAIVCANSLAVLDTAFEGKQLPAPSCKSAAVDENIKLAEKLGITGAPALVLPDGRVVSGYRDANALKGLIDRKWKTG